MIVRTMKSFHVLTPIFLWITLSSAISNLEFIKNQCKEKCNSNLILSNEGNILFCDEDCQKEQCEAGCNLYTEALSSSCPAACTGPQNDIGTREAEARIQKQNCIQGCSFALDIYASNIKAQISNLPRPDLNRSSKKYSSIVLRWAGRVLKNITYLIQRKIVDIPQVSDDWQIHNSSQFTDDGQIYIYNLHPYVTYRFKVLVVVSPLPHHIMESPETIPIMTKPHGVPSSAPKITSLSAPSPSVLSIAWDRPAYTNGEIIAYKIIINPINHPVLKPLYKDILGDVRSWTVGQLQPSQHYDVSVSASNMAGEGPTDSQGIRTPNPGNLSANETPYLILGATNKVLKQNIMDVISLADNVFEETNKSVNITGIGIHIRRQMFIVSDSNETVRQIFLSEDSPRENIYPSILKPTVISVDWLNDRVYIVSRNRIYGCPLDRDACMVVVDNLPRTPMDVKVDPVNGYLYFTQTGPGQGLYRIDLSDIKPHKPVTPTQVVTIDNLQAFFIDFENVRLYFPNHTQNTMLSSFMDGTDIEDIHPNVMKPNLQNVLSLAFYNNTFYWTNGTTMFREEFDRVFDKYRHNQLLFFEDYYRGLCLYHPRMQPTPVPHASPKNLQALFGPTHVSIKWEAPSYLQYQGRGAWNLWDYELQLSEGDNPEGLRQTLNATDEEITVEHLKPDTQYSLRVRAISEAGTGPWSQFFIGRTLKQEKIPVRVLMSTPQTIVETDLYDDSQNTVIHFQPQTHATDIAWHDGLVMWTSNIGSVNIYNGGTNSAKSISQVSYAACLAYDWLGQKIFWSEPQPGVIKRSDLNNLASDFVYQAAARDMAIDSASGRIYWVTTNTIESTFLNGEDLVLIDSVPFFQGKHIISLVLNFDLQKVFWYIKAFEKQDLFMANLISMEGSSHEDIRATVESVGDFRSISKSSGLQYYSHHLFWMDQSNTLVVGDIECNYTSILSPHYSNITAFSVKHPTIQSYPDGLNASTLRVVPLPMSSDSIKVSGPSSGFNLTWNQAHEVNFGRVFYKVYIQIASQSTHIVTSKTWHPINGFSPYTQMTVSIQPYTYWGYSEPSTVSIRSPMGVPTEPLTPRVYITQHKNTTTSQLMLAADFRWSNPHAVRGVLSHHVVHYWEKGESIRKHTGNVEGVFRHFVLNNIQDNKKYFFQVKACTIVGCGPLSSTVSAVTNVVNPVPRLLIATKSSVRLSEMDGHLNSTVLLPEVSPTSLTFLAQDERTFWIEKKNDLYVSKDNVNSGLVDLGGVAKDLSIDWISRTLYIVESLNSTNRIMGYDIDKQVYREILNREADIGSVLSDPYTSSLFWTEKDRWGKGHIYHRPFNNDDIVDFLRSQGRKRRFAHNCTCSERLSASSVVAMDYSKSGETEIFFVDLSTYSIIAADGSGCRCRVVYRTSQDDSRGLHPDMLAVDHLRVYWYNKALSTLFSVNKLTGLEYFKKTIADVQDIVAYGDHLQPLPDSDCLDPGAYSGSVENVEVTKRSVALLLDPVTRPDHCGEISSPQDKYTIYYKTLSRRNLTPHTDCSIERDLCSKVESYEHTVNVTGLEPYTEYLFQVAISNYYTEYLSEAMGNEVIYRTLHGVPSKPLNVQAFARSPDQIQIRWDPPAKPNGPQENISYVVKWSNLNSKGHNLEGQTLPTKHLETVLEDLSFNTEYKIKVLAYENTHQHYSETEPVTVKTFMTPGSFRLVQAHPNALDLVWRSPPDGSVIRHNFKYAKKTARADRVWKTLVFLEITRNYTDYPVRKDNLEPNTEYVFQVQATYNSQHYIIFPWPQDDSATFTTLTDVPDQPEPPIVSELKTGSYEVVWEEPDDNGEQVSHYLLEYSLVVEGEWLQAYNGSTTRWVVDEDVLQAGQRYIFRVAAENSNGLGAYSDNSTVFITPVALMDSSIDGETRVVIAVVISFVFVVLVIIVTAVCVYMRRRKEEKKKARQFISMYPVPDMELATLRELPHTTVQQSNTLYAINIMPTAEDIAALPHFFRDQLTLTKFLGSGAFGEVFMGVALDILGDHSGDTRVAVKTLRKSAMEHEKEEFLKEALLMSNFRHAHILGLLGVCLDNDPQFIIMELMEGGDLLSFLRSCRATTTTPARMLLPDLVKVCVHVARGCKYLEEMHFVHRDLAARNCLVSKKNPSDMVIKIGDFGLARDIYKNDYYRKEGEGLLPVRWMSPESLVDGVFTTPSDIWAFGVLMWEVVTLGQQPYPARTNIEVLHYVRAGGKLERPDKCADEIFNLMQKCWSFAPEDRPSFAYLLQELEEFQQECHSWSPEEIAQRSPTHLDAYLSRSSPTPPQTMSYYGLANLAFDDEVAGVGSLMEAGDPPVPSTAGACPHQSAPCHQRGGGSIHLSPTSRRSQRMTLLGGAEASDKLTVDLSTARPLKSTSSFDSKGSFSDGSQVSYSQIQRQASEMDALGYLQPHSKDMPKYLELLNCAPEVGILQPIPVNPSHHSPSPPSIPSSPSSPTAPTVNYAMMNGNYLVPSPPYGDSPPPPFSKYSNPLPNGSPPPVYSNPPVYGVVSVMKNSEKPPPYHSMKEVSLRSSESHMPNGHCKQMEPHRENELYSRHAYDRHPSDSSSNSESGYYCVECLNNTHCLPFRNEKSVPTYTRVTDDGFSTPPPNYALWSNNNSERNYSRNPPNQQKDIYGHPPDYINVNGQGRSRNQVYPENGNVLAGFDITQASLV